MRRDNLLGYVLHVLHECVTLGVLLLQALEQLAFVGRVEISQVVIAFE